MNSSVHIDNKKKDILLLGWAPTQGLGEHSLIAEKMYPINFTVTKIFFAQPALQWSKQLLFVNGTEIIKFKAKDSNTVSTPLFLGNISKDWQMI